MLAVRNLVGSLKVAAHILGSLGVLGDVDIGNGESRTRSTGSTVDAHDGILLFRDGTICK